ncbi:NACHT domain-containing protein [Streptomyces sp. NPDC058330]|uniref:NACHT domain-containing protein n=1 Tax=Streptomyces sp. NPDC058330 TaxID=3346449 RepID=UPI0036EBA846
MTRLPHHVQRRWVRLGLLALSVAVSLSLGWRLLTAGHLSDDEQLVSWAGLFVSLAALVVSLVPLFPPLEQPRDSAQVADGLAVTVRAQWEEEVTARNLRSPHVIPLAWTATARPVAAPPEETHGGTVDARVLRLSLNGRLEGGFDQAARRLAEGYRQVPSGRLVVLGEPGSGKTVLAAMLNLGLLAEREPGAPVPVLLTLSTWDPVSESLRDWIARTLGTAYYGGRTEKPELLLSGSRLLLILDGLDEMPEAARRSAVRMINESCGEGTGVVLTCRSAEYQDVIEGGSPVLRRAPVVEISPVPTADALAYLSDVSWPAGVDWEPVHEHLRTHPDSPAAVALTTPLSLTLTRTVYSRCGLDPGELLRFDSSHAVEDHLLDHVITAAYAPPPGGAAQQDAEVWRREAKQADVYLTYLATYLHRHRERDLAWWLMSRRLLSRLAGYALGIGVGLAAAFTVMALGRLPGADDYLDYTRGTPVLIGLGVALLTMITWYAAPDRPPGRLSLRRQGSLGRIRTGFATGLKLTAILVVPIAAAVAVVVAFSAGLSEANSVEYLMVLAAVGGAVLAVGLALAVHAWLDAPPEHSTKASPSGLLRQDRTSSLTGALAAGAVLGCSAGPLWILGYSAAFIEFSSMTYGAVAPSSAGFIGARFGTAYDSIAAGAFVTLLPAAAFALVVLLTRAWPRFVVLRLVLAAQGKLPWRLIRFLSDARDRQLLRQFAGTYQFRHIRLQERLAARSPAPDRAPGPDARSVRRRRIMGVAAATVMVAGVLGVHRASFGDSAATFMNTGDIAGMAFSSSEPHVLITVSGKGAVRYWDTRTSKELDHRGTKIPELSDDDFVVTVSENGLVAGLDSDDGYDLRKISWNARKWRETSQVQEGWMRDDLPVGVSSGGRYILYAPASWQEGAGSSVVRVDRGTGAMREIPVGSYAFTQSDWAVSDNGEWLATSEGRSVVIFDEEGRKAASVVVGYGHAGAVALNADGTVLASHADGATRIRDLRSLRGG